MDDDSDEKDSKRKSRNLSEKKRRDQFNLLVKELSSMVSTGGRKMDKSTVLKSTIAFLKNHNEITVRSRINEIQGDWKPTFLTNEEFTHLVLEAVDGFILVFSTSGQIYYASEGITSLLGYLPNDILNMTIYELATDEEQNELYNILISPNEEETQVTFACHLRRRMLDVQESPCYELVHFIGYFKSDGEIGQTEEQFRSYAREVDTRLVFVGTGKLQTPQLIKEMPLVDSTRSEFTSRHSLEWKFLFLDHRAPPIIGYLPFELLGTSGYDYYHVDDLDRVMRCHESLMLKGEGTSCYYRFLTKGQQWIWLQTRFYITYHQWNSKPEFVVCTHRVVSYMDVVKHQCRKNSDRSHPNPSSPEVGSGDAITPPWRERPSPKKGPESDCTSMSADSPASRQSVLTQQSIKSGISQSTKLSSTHQKSQHNDTEQRPVQQPIQQHQNAAAFLEPTQYVAAIPLQPVLTSYSHPQAVISPLTNVDNLIMAPVQNQLQVDLQRKQAELQAIIGQQQQELRRVSEQLLMARLGLLHQTQQQSSTTYQTSSGTVSSTTAPIPALANTLSGSSPSIIPTSVPMPVTSQQSNIMYNTPDSNTQNN
ncbi:hypothetical protein GWI33_021819 [Rhynchophorus ferrugineus]|uniref:Circadian locomoter output cycles protein kaput n=1 Tax=Rhynchophorus ferrugineus TaxID=354439 RepID=A0A834IP75_RHYFE|nr:hypothetical protein GWI33_021819 [Rhynchophorus ferrugineus]